jgi:hypothetical protein
MPSGCCANSAVGASSFLGCRGIADMNGKLTPSPTTSRLSSDLRRASRGLFLCSDGDMMEFALRGMRLVRRQRTVVAIECRAIRAHILEVLAHVAKDMGVVLWWQRTHTHEFLGADLNDRNAKVVMEMRNNFVGHVVVTLCRRFERLAQSPLVMYWTTGHGSRCAISPGRLKVGFFATLKIGEQRQVLVYHP